MSYSHRRNTIDISKGGLLVGYLGLIVALVSVYFDRTTGYEVSIYTATTPLFWGGIATAAVIATAVAVVTYDRPLGAVALALVSLAVLSVFALPSLRGYYFHGHGDALIHLGWAKDIADGSMVATDLLYPGSHLLVIFLAELAGVEIRQAMVLVTLLFRVLFVVFVPLALYTLCRDRRIIFIGTLSALFVLPINHISTQDSFHAFSLAVLLTPFIYYLVFAHVTDYHVDGSLPSWLSPTALVLPLASTALVLTHPQAAFNILLIFATIVGVQFIYRRRKPHHSISQFRGLYGQFVFFALIFFAWAGQFENMYRVLDMLIAGVQETIAGTAETAPTVEQRSQSTAAIGISLSELFVKLFGVSFAYSVLAGGLLLSIISSRLSDAVHDSDGVVVYFAYSGAVLGPFVALHFLGDIDPYSFRQVGFAMGIVTLLGSLALYRLRTRVASVSVDLRPVVATLAIVALALTLLVAFSSPYIALPNSQVTETETEGYATLFDHQGSVPIMGIRTGPERFAAVHQDDSVISGGTVEETVFNEGMWDEYETSRYLALSSYDRQRDIEVYRGFRFSRAGFEQLDTTPGVHRVQTNGDLTVHYID